MQKELGLFSKFKKEVYLSLIFLLFLLGGGLFYLKFSGYKYSLKDKSLKYGDSKQVSSQKTNVKPISAFEEPVRLNYAENGPTLYRFKAKIKSIVTPGKKYLVEDSNLDSYVIVLDSQTTLAKEIEKKEDYGTSRIPEIVSPKFLNSLKVGDFVKITVETDSLNKNKTYTATEFVILPK